MFFIPTIFRPFAALLIAATLVACNIETTPEGQNNRDRDSEDLSVGAFGEAFVKEPLGIQTSWFDYDSTTHAILPRAYIFRLEKGDHTTLFRVKSYYTARGDSGYFSIERLQVGVPGAAPELIELTSSIKDGPVCLALAEGVETDCADARHDLIFRVEFRAVPGAGFAVSNPAIYAASHFLDPQLSKVGRGNFDSFDDASAALDDPGAWHAYKNAQTHPADAHLFKTFHDLKIGDSSPAFLQSSANMKLVGWSVERIAPGELRFSANYVKLTREPEEQSLPLSADAKSATLIINPDALNLVSLCAEGGPEIIEVSATPYRSLGPDGTAYELVIDTLGDTPELRLAPGHYIWSDGAAAIDANTKMPVDLWD